MMNKKPRPISGFWLTLVICVCLILPAVTFPLILKLPLWIEAEIVVGIWWISWCVILTRLLHQGWTIDDDYKPRKSFFSNWDILEGFNFLDFGEGLGGVLAGIVLAFFFALLALVFFELIFPAVAIVAYTSILAMVRTAAHDKHDCEGNWSRSFYYGAVWAAVYTLPIASIVFGTHLLKKAI